MSVNCSAMLTDWLLGCPEDYSLYRASMWVGQLQYTYIASNFFINIGRTDREQIRSRINYITFIMCPVAVISLQKLVCHPVQVGLYTGDYRKLLLIKCLVGY